VSIGNSDGGEVESFGLIAQKHGAKAIVATLWKVADSSTALLMSEFYRLRKTNPRLTKSQALQMAQKEMIDGKLLSPDAKTQRYSHPYYWAPFILIGNWR